VVFKDVRAAAVLKREELAAAPQNTTPNKIPKLQLPSWSNSEAI